MLAPHNAFRAPQRAWSGDTETLFSFPAGWELEVCRMQGERAPRLSEAEFREAFAQPIGGPPLRELARNKKKVVILFDDLSRPTKAYQVVPYVLEELAAAGVDEDRISFLCALGAHGALSAQDFRKKLGPRVVSRFRVYNHNAYENCSYVGTTQRGTRVCLNAEFLDADLRIGLGCVVPHTLAGFGGGAKIVLPGVAAIDTIAHNHAEVLRAAETAGQSAAQGPGRTDGNPVLLDMQEACRMSGLHVKIDALVNLRRDTAALFVGEPQAEFAAAVEQARRFYLTPHPPPADVIVANANAKVNEPGIALGTALRTPASDGAIVVLACDNPYGEVVHYLYGRFGDHRGGRFWGPKRVSHKLKKLIVFMPGADKANVEWDAPAGAVEWVETWDDALAVLQEEYPRGGLAALIPDGTIQYFG